MYNEGITNVLHGGDMLDGTGHVYKWHLNELMVYGYDDAIKYTAENYPKRPWMTTYYIKGNHDEDFVKHGGADIGIGISALRDDMKDLWWYDANIIINGIKFGVHHAWGWMSYARSYRLQKYVENLTGDMKPQVYILGHLHSYIYMALRNIHCMLPACFQKPNNMSKRFGLDNIVWGSIIEIKKTKDNQIRSFTPTFTQYYF